MEHKHTPGPWEFIQKDSGIDIYLAMTQQAKRSAESTYGWFDVHKLCLYGNGHGNAYFLEAHREEAIANARLIAAAPELLEALALAEAFMAGFEDDSSQEGIPDSLRQIRAAIAKATGT